MHVNIKMTKPSKREGCVTTSTIIMPVVLASSHGKVHVLSFHSSVNTVWIARHEEERLSMAGIIRQLIQRKRILVYVLTLRKSANSARLHMTKIRSELRRSMVDSLSAIRPFEMASQVSQPLSCVM
jgi:hypothetical protein